MRWVGERVRWVRGESEVGEVGEVESGWVRGESGG